MKIARAQATLLPDGSSPLHPRVRRRRACRRRTRRAATSALCVGARVFEGNRRAWGCLADCDGVDGSIDRRRRQAEPAPVTTQSWYSPWRVMPRRMSPLRFHRHRIERAAHPTRRGKLRQNRNRDAVVSGDFVGDHARRQSAEASRNAWCPDRFAEQGERLKAENEKCQQSAHYDKATRIETARHEHVRPPRMVAGRGRPHCPGGGCQSSTLLPSGSMTQPNFPYSESSVFSRTSQPSSRSD